MKIINYLIPLKLKVDSIFSNETFRAISNLTGGNLVAIFITLILAVIQARFVSPEDLGYFNSFAIITGYLFFLNLGLHSSVQRLYPYFIGKGETDNAFDVVEICHAWNVTLSAIVGFLFIGLSIYSAVIGNWKAALAWFAQALVAISMIYGAYLSVTFRSAKDFNALAKGTFLGAIFSLLALPIYFIQPYVALALRNGMGTVFPLIYWHVKRPIHPRWNFSWGKWIKYNKIGLPMFIASYSAGILWRVIENTLVLNALGARSLGLWSVCLMILSVANNIPQSITAVYNPKIIQEFGRTESVSETFHVLKKPLILGTVLLVVSILVSSIILPLVVPIIIPQYIEAVPVMLIMLIDLFFTLFDLPYAILLAQGKVFHRILAVICGLVGFFILATIFLNSNFGLIGLVIASLFGKMIRTSLTVLFIYKF